MQFILSRIAMYYFIYNTLNTVQDNGIGMNEEELKNVIREMQRDKTSGTIAHIGLQNVNSRLKLLYKEHLRIESTYGYGTNVWFYLRLQNKECENLFLEG